MRQRLAGLAGTARRRDRPDPRVERPGPVRVPQRAALLAAQRPPVRPVGAPDPSRHRRTGARLARRRPPHGQPGRPRGDPAAGRAPDVQLARDRDVAAPDPRTWPSTSSTSTTTSSWAGRSAPRRCSAPAGLPATFLGADDDRPHRPARLSAVPQGGLEQPAPPPGSVRPGDHPQPGARALRAPPLRPRAADRALPGRAGRHGPLAVPLRHRRLDPQLAGPALRADDRDRRTSATRRGPTSTSPTATSTGS